MKLHRLDIYRLINKLNLLMGVSAAVLIIILTTGLMRPYKIDRNLQITPLADTKFMLQDVKTVFQEEVFKRRPLFNESGRKKASEPKKEFILLGVSIGKKNLAMLRDNVSKKDYYCAEGDMIGDYKVKQILKDRVILETEGNTLEIGR